MLTFELFLRFVLPDVRLHVIGQLEPHSTNRTFMRSILRMLVHVDVEIGGGRKDLFANVANVLLLYFYRVHFLGVFLHLGVSVECLGTVWTFVFLEFYVGISVPQDVVANWEGFIAQQALMVLE